MDTKPTAKNLLIVILLVILTIFTIFFLVIPKVKENRINNENKDQVVNFEECIKAGNPAMESYPRQCRHGNRTFTENIKNYPKSNGKLKAIDCLLEQRNVDMCIEIYQPVCGQMQVECIKAPCYMVKKTFANSCKACMNSRVLSYTEGECAKNTDIKY